MNTAHLVHSSLLGEALSIRYFCIHFTMIDLQCIGLVFLIRWKVCVVRSTKRRDENTGESLGRSRRTPGQMYRAHLLEVPQAAPIARETETSRERKYCVFPGRYAAAPLADSLPCDATGIQSFRHF